MNGEQKRLLSVQLTLSVLGALAMYAAMMGGARSHDAASGWTYPLACCSGIDCREVGDAYTDGASVRVFERPEGYVISSTGEVVPMTSAKVRESPDGRFHWCSVQGMDDGKTICLFVPPRAY